MQCKLGGKEANFGLKTRQQIFAKEARLIRKLKVALSYFEMGACMFSFDLKSGYHHVEIYEQHQTYLEFSWTSPVSKETNFHKFTVLAFSLPVYIFPKVLKPFEKLWRYLGIRIAIFLDDGWDIEKDKDACSHTSDIVKADLAQAGFISNDEKSVWTPCQSLTWIGILWHAHNGTIELTSKKAEKILATIQHIRESGFARELASFTGQIISTGPIIGNITRLMTRHCILSTVSAAHWDEQISLDEYTKQEISFWHENLAFLKTRHCFLNTKPHIFVYSDASDTGCGSVISLDSEQFCHKLWDREERLKIINNGVRHSVFQSNFARFSH